jgi:2-phospho-L-lactate transferase/gluconeogenesis factor (CofD/UPF0052 family)
MAKAKASKRVVSAIKSAMESMSISNVWVTKQEKGTKTLENVCSGVSIDSIAKHYAEDYWMNVWFDTNDLTDAEFDQIIEETCEVLHDSNYYLGTKYPHESIADPKKISLAILEKD